VGGSNAEVDDDDMNDATVDKHPHLAFGVGSDDSDSDSSSLSGLDVSDSDEAPGLRDPADAQGLRMLTGVNSDGTLRAVLRWRHGSGRGDGGHSSSSSSSSNSDAPRRSMTVRGGTQQRAHAQRAHHQLRASIRGVFGSGQGRAEPPVRQRQPGRPSQANRTIHSARQLGTSLHDHDGWARTNSSSSGQASGAGGGGAGATQLVPVRPTVAGNGGGPHRTGGVATMLLQAGEARRYLVEQDRERRRLLALQRLVALTTRELADRQAQVQVLHRLAQALLTGAPAAAMQATPPWSAVEAHAARSAPPAPAPRPPPPAAARATIRALLSMAPAARRRRSELLLHAAAAERAQQDGGSTGDARGSAAAAHVAFPAGESAAAEGDVPAPTPPTAPVARPAATRVPPPPSAADAAGSAGMRSLLDRLWEDTVFAETAGRMAALASAAGAGAPDAATARQPTGQGGPPPAGGAADLGWQAQQRARAAASAAATAPVPAPTPALVAELRVKERHLPLNTMRSFV
jgi:hypothetical protein